MRQHITALAERRRHDDDEAQGRRKQAGFTLIELMVVLLIIGILMAIAIPTYLSERNKAQNTAAQTTDRNALTAVQAVYAANNAYVVPPSSTATGFPAYMATQEPALKWSASAVSALNSVSVATFDSDNTTGTPQDQSIVLTAWTPTGGGTCWSVAQINYTGSSSGLSPGTYYNKAAAASGGCTAAAPTTTTGWGSSWATAG